MVKKIIKILLMLGTIIPIFLAVARKIHKRHNGKQFDHLTTGHDARMTNENCRGDGSSS